MTMLSDFLNEHAIKPEDLVAASRHLETPHITERALFAKRKEARVAKKTYAELSLDKPKPLGRALTRTALDKALRGETMPRLVRKKIARAVNSLLTTKKQETVEARKLFGDVKSRKGKKKK